MTYQEMVEELKAEQRPYYGGETPQLGDLFQSGWAGTCRLVEINEDFGLTGHNTQTGELLDGVRPEDTDLLERAKGGAA